MEIILASRSPRRRELLAQIGFSFTIDPAIGDEKITGTAPAEIVKDLSCQKAEEVAARHGEDAVIIGADTMVALDGRVLGKPKDNADAVRMLKLLQGHTHSVYTGVTLLRIGKDADDGGKIRDRITFAEETRVTFYAMSEDEIRAYVATGEPADKAGAYGIQGRAAAYISGIEGDYNTVVGLPVGRIYQEVKKWLSGIA